MSDVSEAAPSPDDEATRRRASRDLRGDLVRYLPSQALPALIAFVTIPILTRLLSPAEFGDYRLVLAAVSAFGAAGAWIAAAVYRFFPEMELAGRLEAFRATVNGLLGFTLALFAVLWLGGTWGLRPWIGVERADLFFIGAVLMAVNTAWGIFNAQVRAVREVGWYSLSVILNKALTLGLGVGLVLLADLRVDGLLYGSVVASLLLVPLLFRVIKRRFPPTGRFDRDLARQMLRYGLPIALVQLVDWALQLSDRFIIAAFRNEAEVGLYSAAYGIAEQGMATIVLMFELPFSVLANRVWERDGREAAATFVSDSTRSYLLVAIPAWAGISILAGPIMTVMTDTPYLEAAVIMPVVSLALLIGAIQFWYTSGAIFNKKTGQTVISMAAAVAVNLVLNLLLVDRFGYQVAAVTSLVGYVVALVLMVWLSRRDFRWVFPFPSLVRGLAAASVMSGAIWAITRLLEFGPLATLAVSIPLGVVVYGLALLALGEPQARTVIGRFLR